MPKSDDFEVLSQQPFNGQPPLERLALEPITPVERFYVRNHAPVPKIEERDYRLEVGGMIERPLRLTLADLKDNFGEAESTVTLQCAGNRRSEMHRARPLPAEEILWSASAVGNAVWRGALLSEVLATAGCLDGPRHVDFLGLDRIEKDGVSFGFGGSIPLSKALSGDVLLAWDMNGEPLAPEHGAPLRVVVPGYIGARSVKWLAHVVVRYDPSENYYQRRAYRHFAPHVTPETVAHAEGIELGELSVNSAIMTPGDGAELPVGAIELRGYATAGGERTVERVEVSADNGSSWIVADLERAPVGVWRFWNATVELDQGPHELVCRAWDSAANTQPENPADVWNFRGYMHHAWHRARVWVR